MKRSVVALLLLLAEAPPLLAGPWSAGRGHYYVKLSAQRLVSTTLAAPDGTRFDIPRFLKEDAGVFLAYGLTDRLTLAADLPAYRSSDLQDFRRESGLGDVRVGVQVGLGRRGPWVFAVRGTLQAPSGDETRAGGLLPTGSGVWEGEVAVSAGRSLGRGYGFAEIGHGLRGGGLANGLVYGAQVGWNVSSRLVLAANLRGVEPYRKAPRDVPVGSPAGLSDRVTYLTYGPTAILGLGRGFGIQLDVERSLHTRNVAPGTVFRGGLFLAR